MSYRFAVVEEALGHQLRMVLTSTSAWHNSSNQHATDGPPDETREGRAFPIALLLLPMLMLMLTPATGYPRDIPTPDMRLLPPLSPPPPLLPAGCEPLHPYQARPCTGRLRCSSSLPCTCRIALPSSYGYTDATPDRLQRPQEPTTGRRSLIRREVATMPDFPHDEISGLRRPAAGARHDAHLCCPTAAPSCRCDGRSCSKSCA